MKEDSEGSIFERYYTLFFVLIVATPICAINSAVQTALQVGFSSTFSDHWARGFALAYVLTVPAALVAVPLARRALDQLSSKKTYCESGFSSRSALLEHGREEPV